MDTFAWVLGLLGIVLVIDAVLAIGFGEKYISFIADYAPVEYVAFVYDVTHSSSETQIFVRLGEIFIGYIMLMLAQRSG
jgi:hypothetical protein